MIFHSIPFTDTNSFSQFFIDYISKKETLKPFYNQYPDKKEIIELAQKKEFKQEKRAVLSNILIKQYESLTITNEVRNNIESLKNSNTVTVTTGHQLCLLGGPLYFIYKIITTIKTCAELNKEQSKIHFVPVFWMASEDHDFEEVNHINLFGKKHEWKTEQKGAVGRFEINDLLPLLEEIKDLPEAIKNAYKSEKNLAKATRNWVNSLFGETGLVIIDADDKELKKQFVEIIRSDVFENKAFELVKTQSEKLINLGYNAQISPREINFFYLENNRRERIIKENNQYRVNNTDIVFLPTELDTLILNYSEKFSPNVVLRPIYQEIILPNISYIGGPGELAYWLQLKPVFDYYNVSFPVLQPRNFYLYINDNLIKRIRKFGFSFTDLFKETLVLKEKFKNENDLRVSFENEKKAFSNLFDELKQKVKSIDVTLEATVIAEMQKNHSALEIISKKVDKAIEQKNEQSISQIVGLKEKLFPNGNLQERHDNFLSIYLNQPQFIAELLEKTNPFDFQMNIIEG